jgi:geranylgeranyl diphosphate synthase type II
MDAMGRIERALTTNILRGEAAGCPPKLAAAVRHAVFPRGARIRPRLCLAVAGALGEDAPGLTDAAAAAIEFLHCASLVHDDLPCFDNADIRRGKPTVHRAFGEPIAVLAGDALIVQAFETVTLAGRSLPDRLPALLTVIARSVGMPNGIAAGQAWECEPEIDLSAYQRAKTGALFAAATMAGAAAAGANPEPWRDLGNRLGEAFQVADDILDVAAKSEDIGKPTGQDKALDRPNAVARYGLDGAVVHLRTLAKAAIDSVPLCPGAKELRAHILSETQRLVPKQLDVSAA